MGVILQLVGRCEQFDKTETESLLLHFKSLFHGFFGLANVLHIIQGHTCGICSPPREAMISAILMAYLPYPGYDREGRLWFLAFHCGGSHLSAGHTVNSVVYEYDGHFFTTVSAVHNFSHTNGCEVAVTLIGEDELVTAGAFTPVATAGARPCGASTLSTLR